MNTRITRTIGAVAAAAALTVALAACDSAKDTANDAKDAATSAAGSAASAVTGANGSGAGESGAGESGANGAGGSGAGSESKAAVPSTKIATPGGTEVTLTDGPIIGEYAKYGYEKGHLGAPLGPVSALPDGKGKYLTLKGGTIYWSQASGAHVVHGVIGDKWGDAGHEAGKLGYPTSDETAENGAIKQTFQNGTITFRDGVATVS
ncbi:LGFP repeat-containing protein [Tsukamurella ocularis]|uniref:LGFP repeat-containing protein n=1 Tax=Tsukamurella ocularis TaxID=1970234 RepID=UPI0039F061DA